MNIPYIKNTQGFIMDFIQNKGVFVFTASLIEKICVLIYTIVIARLLPPDLFGELSLALVILGLLIPFMGLGSYQGLLRYGMLISSSEEKDQLSRYTFYKGLLFTIIIGLLYVFIAYLYSFKFEYILYISLLLIVRIFGVYLYSQLCIDYRIRNQNEKYAKLSIFFNVSSLIGIVFATYFFGFWGCVTAFAVSPFIMIVFAGRYLQMPTFQFPKSLSITKFWKYSWVTALSFGLSELILMNDHLMAGLYFSDDELAQYRVASLIPFNILFISRVWFQTDYPKIAEKYLDKSYLQKYYTNYVRLFLPFALFFLGVMYFLKDLILPFVFGEVYNHGDILWILCFYSFISMLFYVPLGNIFSAIGKSHINVYILIGMLIVMHLSCYLLKNELGILSIAYSVVITFLFAGIAMLMYLYGYLRSLQSEN